MTINNRNIATIILNYFGYKLCISCIESVFNELDTTIFLVDNSADKHEKKSLITKYHKNKNVKLIFPEKNIGFAAGVNWALKEALQQKFNTFFLLNNDASLLKGSGPYILKSINNNLCTLISPTIYWNDSIRRYNYYHRCLGLIATKQPAYFTGWLKYFTGCALIFDNSVLQKIGNFNESFFMYGEDVEFCYRAKNKKIPFFNIPEKLIFHKGSESSQMASFFYEYHINRSHFLLTFMINETSSQKMISFSFKIFSLLSRALFRAIRYQKITPIIALIASPFKLSIRPKSNN